MNSGFELGWTQRLRPATSRRRGSAQAGVQVGQQGGHLFLIEAAGEGGHHSLPGQNDVLDGGVGRRDSAGQLSACEEVVKIGRNFFELKVVVAMAVGAAHLVEMLAFGLLRSEFGFAATAREKNGAQEKNGHED